MEELERKIKAFVEERDWDRFHSPKNLAMALAVEVAELMEHFQWLTDSQSRSLDRETRGRVGEEIGDILIYLVQLSRKLGIDPLQAAHEKVVRNRVKYPAERVRGKALKYSAYGTAE